MRAWVTILRLGLVQMALGAVVVLTTSTLNRLMVVELAAPAMLPGALVALHYIVQLSRPGWGLRSDLRGGRTPFILAGMAALAGGAFLAALALPVMALVWLPGLVLSTLAYVLIGGGAGAAGTSLLALLATVTPDRLKPAAAMTVWLMMIMGIAVTAGGVGALIDPYSPARLLQIVAAVGLAAVALSALAVAGVERRGAQPIAAGPATSLRLGVAEVWAEPEARHFTLFVLLSMTAYFLQELILEPYAGLVFGLTPGQSTQLSGAQHGGVFAGMLTVGLIAGVAGRGSPRGWVVAGCLGSAATLVAIAGAGRLPGAEASLTLVPAVVALGFCNGMFAVAAIAAMMALAGKGRAGREGTRMGLWGAAQALAAGFGGLAGAAGSDALRLVLPANEAFGLVFLAEAALFLTAAAMAARTLATRSFRPHPAAIAGE